MLKVTYVTESVSTKLGPEEPTIAMPNQAKNDVDILETTTTHKRTKRNSDSGLSNHNFSSLREISPLVRSRRGKPNSCLSCFSSLTEINKLPPQVGKNGPWCWNCYNLYNQHHNRCTVCPHVPTWEELKRSSRCKKCSGGTWLFDPDHKTVEES